MSGDNFQADPDRLDAVNRSTEGLISQAASIKEAFLKGFDDLWDWAGMSDSYYQQAYPQFMKSVNSVTSILNSVQSSLIGMMGGHSQSSQGIRNTTGGNLSDIAEAQGEQNNVGLEDGGGRP
jgi:uncharacterized protein YukE